MLSLSSACPSEVAPRQLRYGALGQHEERHHDQAQDGRHGHHVGLQVAACHQCVDDVARRVAERHAAEHEGHAQPEDVQGVLVAPARGVNEQHPGKDVEELVAHVDDEQRDGGVAVEQEGDGHIPRHHDGQRQTVDERGVEALALLRHDGDEGHPHHDEGEDGAAAEKCQWVHSAVHGVEHAAKQRERHDREHELSHAQGYAAACPQADRARLRRVRGPGIGCCGRRVGHGRGVGAADELAPGVPGAARVEDEQGEGQERHDDEPHKARLG